jgi:ATP-dependent RNA helicase RhlE
VDSGDVDLSNIDMLVLDEADRMLDMGFWPQVRKSLKFCPEQRQNLLFSATMGSDVLRIIGSTLTDPAHVDVAPATTPIEAIDQKVYPVGGQQKAELLSHIIREESLDRVLVFTRTKHRADRVTKVLGKAGIKGAAIHGDRSQAQRVKALESFRAGHVHVLVATDVVSRGIDIDGITHVVNYDLPNSAEDYVHRIGRTARAGKSGTAITLLAPEEHETLRDIERKIGAVLESADSEGFDYSHQRIVPNPEREATPAKPRTVYGGGVFSRRGGGGRRGRR